MRSDTLCGCTECTLDREAVAMAIQRGEELRIVPVGDTRSPDSLLAALRSVLALVDRHAYMTPEQQLALWQAMEVAR